MGKWATWWLDHRPIWWWWVEEMAEAWYWWRYDHGLANPRWCRITRWDWLYYKDAARAKAQHIPLTGEEEEA